MSSLKRKNNKKTKRKSKAVIPKEAKGTLLHMLDVDESFSQSDEAVVVVEKPVSEEPPLCTTQDARPNPVTTPTPKDEFQCSKATLL